ncbi:MAG: chromosome segregation protein SMC, partial [Sphingobacteriales bacterium]|nr:chromosome segregation protein SMC [Sphingobacteriales bacterium]
MRLKSLEIKGFKSFADKTVINFDEGVTGIIGPNGCGKSNIIDSIRWVIGEHKISNLRSENLESLVFNGSKSRSASGLAEVSLTFENTKNLLPTEFNTVTISRKYYKSGESEYRLNDVSCRLKDIHNLFLDTGVSNDSYAIIELGMVDDIIKDKDNSRRKMLEQAAGISIYKTRKKEAKLKLDATEQDLARIEDLLFELNNQLKTLESQAKKAEKYYEIKKEYKEVSVELAKAALEGFNITYKSLNEQTETETDKRIQLEASIAQMEAGLEGEKVGFIEKERELQSLQHTFNDLLNDLRGKESEKSLSVQRLQYLKEKEAGIKDFLEKSEGQLKGIEEGIAFTSQQIHDEENVLNELQGKLDELKNTVDDKRRVFDEKRSHVDELRKENQAIQRNQFEAEKKVAVADTSIANLQRSIYQLKDEQQQRQEQLRQLEAEKQQKEHELGNKKAELENLQQQHEFTKDQILQTQQIMETLRNQLAEENRKLDSKKNEHGLLKSLIDSMEGYPESVKFLHNNTNWNHTAPILSDIIYCKEEYRTAIENLLEQYLNYYVVENLREGLQAVQLLHESQKGKANFFLLDKFDGFNGDNSLASLQIPNAIPALEVVEIDPKYRNLAKYLLGNVFIASNEEALNTDADAIIVEKSGKFYKGKYSLTGGSIGLFEGKKLGRVKNLEKLEEEILEQERVVLDLKSTIQIRHNEVIGYNEQLKENAIKQTEQEINQLTNQVYALQNKMENLNGMENNAVQRLQDLEGQLEQNHDAIASEREELDKLNTQLDELSERIGLVEQDYSTAEQEYNFANAAFNENNLSYTRQQSKLAALKQELDFKTNQLNDLRTQIESNSTQLTEAASNIVESHSILEGLEATLVSLLQNKEAEEKRLNEADQAYYNMRNALGEKESELR